MSLKERVVEMKEEVENLKKEYQETNLTMDLLKELKAQNKRQYATIIILIFTIIAMIVGFFIYEQQFETISEETTIDSGNGTATYLENSNAGDINYGENN